MDLKYNIPVELEVPVMEQKPAVAVLVEKLQG